MANSKVDHQSVGSIAQAMKYQVRTGDAWDNLTGAAKESIDQILSSIARTVSSGQGVHWDGIIAYADAAKGLDAPVKPPATGELERNIRTLVRELPRNGDER